MTSKLSQILKNDPGVKESYRHAPKRVTPGDSIETNGAVDQAVKRSPNIGRPLFDSAFVASSCNTSQCSARRPFSILIISAAIQATGPPYPEKRPWTMT